MQPFELWHISSGAALAGPQAEDQGYLVFAFAGIIFHAWETKEVQLLGHGSKKVWGCLAWIDTEYCDLRTWVLMTPSSDSVT